VQAERNQRLDFGRVLGSALHHPDKGHRPPHKCVANVNAMRAPSCTYPP